MPNEPVGCLGFLFGASREDGRAASLPSVHVNKYFISDAEVNFLHVLRQTVGEKTFVLTQVSLQRMLWFPGNNHSNPGRAVWRNKVAQKSVDFLLCDARTFRPKLVIELDDSSHARPDRQARDEDVEMILQAARLPIIHVLTSRSYDTRELAAAIAPYI